MRAPGDILLCSTYELGRSPTALASPLAFLRRAGFAPACLDFGVEPLDARAEAAFAKARLVAISVPMHTALRLGVTVGERVRAANPGAHVAFYGLYAPLHAAYLRRAGADTILGGECEEALVDLADALAAGRPAPVVPPTLRRLTFLPPERDALPPLSRYAKLLVTLPDGTREERLVGTVDATRGCRHLCRHCPIPSVYAGRFFAVPAEVVVADALAQIDAGARHITFGDPDFLNAPKHALTVARAIAAARPGTTFDATIKVEHLLAHGEVLPELARLGCAFVVSAFESMSDEVLEILDKGHTAAGAHEALALARTAGISLRPTFVPFTPWTTRADYVALCRFVLDQDLVDEVDPVQLSLRLLVPPGSLLLEHPAMAKSLGALDEAALTYLWTHPDPAMDALQREVAALCEDAAETAEPAERTFARILALATGGAASTFVPRPSTSRRTPPPRLSEPWFC